MGRVGNRYCSKEFGYNPREGGGKKAAEFLENEPLNQLCVIFSLMIWAEILRVY